MKKLLITLLASAPLFAMALDNYNIKIKNSSANTLTFTPTDYTCLNKGQSAFKLKESGSISKDYLYKTCDGDSRDTALAYDISNNNGETLNIIFAVTRNGNTYTTMIQRNGQGILDMESAKCSADGSNPVKCDLWPGWNKLEVNNPNTITAEVEIK